MRKTFILTLVLFLTSNFILAKRIISPNDDIINVLSFGAKINDKSTITTVAINKAIKAAGSTKTVYIPAGTYWIKAHAEDQNEGYPNYERGLTVMDGTKIKMDPETYLKVIPNDKEHYNIFSLFGKNNVTIEGGNLIGDRYGHKGRTGEWGYGILIFGGNNLSLKNINCSDFWGDGINIQYSYGKSLSDYDFVANNVVIENVHSSNNRRQGMSIEGGRNFSIKNCSFSNTNGTNPQFGVDIEPSIKPAIVDGVYFENCKFSNNSGSGLGIAGSASIMNVSLKNCIFDNDTVWTGNNFSSGFTVEDCIFNNISDMIINNGDNIKIINNVFNDSWFSMGGITTKNDAVVTGNTAILKTSRDFSGSSIRYNNLIFENNTLDFSQTINPEKDYESGFAFIGNNLSVKGNTFKSLIAGIAFREVSNTTFDNNILSSIQKVTLVVENSSNIILKNNSYYDTSYSTWTGSMFYIVDSKKISFVNEQIQIGKKLQARRYPANDNGLTTILKMDKKSSGVTLSAAKNSIINRKTLISQSSN